MARIATRQGRAVAAVPTAAIPPDDYDTQVNRGTALSARLTARR